MPFNPPCLVFTDLDGTLLDHFSYSHEAAMPMMVKLQAANIPIIINTSKTFAEVVDIQGSLDIEAPFIVENGAAIFLPKSQFKACPTGCVDFQNYWLKSFSQPRAYWLTLLKNEAQEYQDQFQGFSELSTKTIANLTGLSLSQAEKANQRLFNEPVLWHDTAQKAQAFINHMKNRGANVLRGGRFIHIGDFTDKGKALQWLTALYQKSNSAPITTLALGDGENDNAMLEAASIAIQIRSPAHGFPKLSTSQFTYQSQAYGPAGWSEALAFLIPSIWSTNNNCSTTKERKYG
ncbi:HAD-IIB family hydrolase [Thalassotalea sp. LPB0316]|uniref:HAD-IIB family hydrolase n=1 Tax=Thalassotalea sp. LPB0316 TaxID=2769490 RepID=UPI0018661F3A|nr:HAD-IIB family hydrolase [Thalassotalea sp. LPB0316]QOL26553.1 HAD-IIB family hydrolase [Thalassotalea sp. LPB0316]